MIGPPGCGKTHIAKAVAGETNMYFYSITANDLLSPIVGKSEKIVNKLFSKVRKTGGIIFIDEIDSFPDRKKVGGYANSLLNQILTEMDGFENSENILVIAATNMEDKLDEA